MELFFENKKMNVDELQIFDWQLIALVTDGKKEFHRSEEGWDIDTGFELHVRRVKE